MATTGVVAAATITVLAGTGAEAVARSAEASAQGSSAIAAKPNPETKKRKPDQDLGYYLGSPSPTYQWHGCTKTATYRAPAPTGSEPDFFAQNPGYAPRKGSKQGAVGFSVASAATSQGWAVRWQAKNPKKWKICGVQVTGGFARPGVSERYVAQAGYTSSAKKGSTATTAAGETWKLDVPKNSKFGWAVPPQYEGKKLDTKIIYAVTVFVTKK